MVVVSLGTVTDGSVTLAGMSSMNSSDTYMVLPLMAMPMPT